jgi:CBS domain containing-hemolysin-like protein
VTNAIFRVTHFHDLTAAPFITDEEFKSALSEGEAESVLEQDEREMIRGILEFRDVLLREIRVPRPDVVCLPADATVREALMTFREKEYSRMPVYEESLDKVLGVLVAKDLIPCIGRDEPDRPVRELVRPPHFVPKTMTVQQYVDDARRHRSHMAIVVDEYGGTEGIVTLEDAMEEVVGDIMDEDEQEEPLIQQSGEGLYRVDGRLPLDELSDMIGARFEDLSHDTVAGFIMEHLDKVPDPGDTIEAFGARFTVEACEGKRVTKVRLEELAKPVAAEESEELA